MRPEEAPSAHAGAILVAAALDVLDEAVFIVNLAGEIVYANNDARDLAGIGAAPCAPFALLWREAPREVAMRLARMAGASSWSPFALTLPAAAGDLRVPLKGRGMVMETGGARTHHVLIRHDPDRRQPFAEHKRLIRRLNEELGKGQAAERELKRLLETERRLNRELVHRVKNNLALLASLLRQSRLKSGTSDGPLAEFERRLLSVAAVHDVLDRNAQTDYVDVDQMIERICLSLKALAPPGVSLAHALIPLRIHVDRATALALIVNELLTNAFKHAFPSGREGAITVSLARAGELVEARIGDDGIGTLHAPRDGTGSRIIAGLAIQLEARVELVDGGTGTHWLIVFRPQEPPAAAGG